MKCCFTSTETVGLLGTGAVDGHLHFHTFTQLLNSVFQATTIPALYGVWGRWAPKTEISQLLGITFAGQMIANAVVFPFSALLCECGFWGGWPLVFYVFGK